MKSFRLSGMNRFTKPPLIAPVLVRTRVLLGGISTHNQCTRAVVHASAQHSLAGNRKAVARTGTEESSGGTSSIDFWASKKVWTRSSVNTFRCLVGCTTGDFATMWYLQSAYPELGTAMTMGLSMAAGITTSIILETALLHWGKDSLPWKAAIRTATGMSMISMLAMEAAENAVDYSLTGGCVDFGSPYFWSAAALASVAGFLVPLPYNYFRLRKYSKSCH